MSTTDPEAPQPSTPGEQQVEPVGGQPEAAPVDPAQTQPAPSDPSGQPTAPAPTAPAPSEQAGGQVQTPAAGGPQPHEYQAPTEPAASGGGPQDALDDRPNVERADQRYAEPLPGQDAPTQPAAVTGGAPVRGQVSNPGETFPGPEDALDPYAEKRADYTGRVDDAVHMHFAELPPDQQTIEGPRTAPVAQNTLAEEHLARLPESPESAEDPAAAAARERAEDRGAFAAGSSAEEPVQEQTARPDDPAAPGRGI